MSSSGWSAIVSGSPLSSTVNVKGGSKTGSSRHRQWMLQHRRGRATRGRSRSRSRSRSRAVSGARKESQRRQRSKSRKEPDSRATSRTRSRSQSVTHPHAASDSRGRPRTTSQVSNRSTSLRSHATVVAAATPASTPTPAPASVPVTTVLNASVSVVNPTSAQNSDHFKPQTGDGDRDDDQNVVDIEDIDYENTADAMTPAFHMPTKVDYFPGALAPPLVKLFRYVHQHRDEYVAALRDIVCVRSVSSRPDCWPNVMRLLSWVELRLKRLGAFTDMVSVPRQKAVRDYNGRPLTPPPVLLATLGQAGERRRLLVYLHVDAAPLWGSCEALAPPCELTFQDNGRTMQGRGVFECKGPLLCWLLALEALHHMHVQLPVALKFLVQGAHEIGSPGLEELLSVRRRSFLRDVDAICVTKLSWLTQCKPCVVHGLRGLAYFHLEVKAGATNMDSGHVGGSVSEPLADLIYLLNSLQDRNGEPAIDGLMQGVPPLTREEEKHLSHVAFDCAQLRGALGAPKLRFNENKTEVLKHRWRLPSLSFHGIQGALSGAGSATGMPRAVVGKFSVRLVPKQTPERAAAAVRRHVEAAWAARHSPNHMRLTVTATARPWLESATSPHFSAARRAAKRVYKVEPDVIRDGGSMEVVLLLQRLCPRSLVVLPLGAGGGAHSADETLRVSDFLDGIKLVASYMFEVSQVRKKELVPDAPVPCKNTRASRLRMAIPRDCWMSSSNTSIKIDQKIPQAPVSRSTSKPPVKIAAPQIPIPTPAQKSSQKQTQKSTKRTTKQKLRPHAKSAAKSTTKSTLKHVTQKPNAQEATGQLKETQNQSCIQQTDTETKMLYTPISTLLSSGVSTEFPTTQNVIEAPINSEAKTAETPSQNTPKKGSPKSAKKIARKAVIKKVKRTVRKQNKKQIKRKEPKPATNQGQKQRKQRQTSKERDARAESQKPAPVTPPKEKPHATSDAPTVRYASNIKKHSTSSRVHSRGTKRLTLRGRSHSKHHPRTHTRAQTHALSTGTTSHTRKTPDTDANTEKESSSKDKEVEQNNVDVDTKNVCPLTKSPTIETHPSSKSSILLPGDMPITEGTKKSATGHAPAGATGPTAQLTKTPSSTALLSPNANRATSATPKSTPTKSSPTKTTPPKFSPSKASTSAQRSTSALSKIPSPKFTLPSPKTSVENKITSFKTPNDRNLLKPLTSPQLPRLSLSDFKSYSIIPTAIIQTPFGLGKSSSENIPDLVLPPPTPPAPPSSPEMSRSQKSMQSSLPRSRKPLALSQLSTAPNGPQRTPSPTDLPESVQKRSLTLMRTSASLTATSFTREERRQVSPVRTSPTESRPSSGLSSLYPSSVSSTSPSRSPSQTQTRHLPSFETTQTQKPTTMTTLVTPPHHLSAKPLTALHTTIASITKPITPPLTVRTLQLSTRHASPTNLPPYRQTSSTRHLTTPPHLTSPARFKSPPDLLSSPGQSSLLRHSSQSRQTSPLRGISPLRQTSPPRKTSQSRRMSPPRQTSPQRTPPHGQKSPTRKSPRKTSPRSTPRGMSPRSTSPPRRTSPLTSQSPHTSPRISPSPRSTTPRPTSPPDHISSPRHGSSPRSSRTSVPFTRRLLPWESKADTSGSPASNPTTPPPPPPPSPEPLLLRNLATKKFP